MNLICNTDCLFYAPCVLQAWPAMGLDVPMDILNPFYIHSALQFYSFILWTLNFKRLWIKEMRYEIVGAEPKKFNKARMDGMKGGVVVVCLSWVVLTAWSQRGGTGGDWAADTSNEGNGWKGRPGDSILSHNAFNRTVICRMLCSTQRLLAYKWWSMRCFGLISLFLWRLFLDLLSYNFWMKSFWCFRLWEKWNIC